MAMPHVIILTLVRRGCGLPVLLISFLLNGPMVAAPATSPPPGLAVTLSGGGRSQTMVLPDVALFVPAGQSASPFIAPGPFTAVWEGNVLAELRGNYLFQAELAGTLKLEINGQPVLEAAGTAGAAGSKTPLSKPFQLNKGPNALKATFTSAGAADSFVRLGWTEKGTNVSPIPKALFTHATSPALAKSQQLASGRELFLEHRCVRCHTRDPLPAATTTAAEIAELKMDAPALDGIGARRHYEWMTRWILDPKSVRPAARMPKLLHGPTAGEDATAIAAYLASLQGEQPKPKPARLQTRQILPDNAEAVATTEPRPIYERLQCAGCHNPPDAKEIDPAKLSQKGVGTKFPKGRLAEYLLAPEAGFAWTRMPNFHLSLQEAHELENYLLSTSDAPKDLPAPTDAPLLEKGRKLVQSTGCLNCHSLKLENPFKAPSLDALHSRHLKDRTKIPAGDCLGNAPMADFNFTPEQKRDLNEFTLAGFDSLQRAALVEFAARQTRLLNCTACHGQIELVPPLDILGGKLKPEWSARFLAGEIPHKLRFDTHPKGEVWVEARMPAFSSRAGDLARGMAAMHGYPPVTPAEGPVDQAAAEIGRKLVGKDGGFSCVACHAVGSQPALEVFESEGLNLAWAADRLLPNFYRRWFRNPLSIDPQTKMPMYFDEEGASPLTDTLSGNGDAQIDAVWHYLRLGDKMLPPKAALE
jgi:mono/diheme cytochrome c family protein